MWLLLSLWLLLLGGCAVRTKVCEQILVIFGVHRAKQPVPVCKVQREVLGWVAVVHVMVLHCIEGLAAAHAGKGSC